MKLELYHFRSCPFCQRVFHFLEKNNLNDKITYYDILEDEKARQRLLSISHGDEQVPCLVIGGKPLLESLDIIDWLTKHFSVKK